ncbi:hypothetical protein CFC21_081553 [Triticum aestivum]|uniref:Uncharacterized protein n=1 Tax=Triticum aestivum TaxID=4565 RepID=A0A9R1I4I9_WHEAT|nr:hypothetical protein CFC21_081553 [Triticum aestivum]
MANGKNVMAMLFLTTIVAVAATRPAETYGAAEENTLKMATPSKKGVDATLAATRVVAAEKSIKKAESATTPEEAATAKQDGSIKKAETAKTPAKAVAAKRDAAKSVDNALKYDAISRKAAGTSSSTSPNRKEGTTDAAKMFTKKAETATTPEEAANAKQAAAKSTAATSKYGVISQQVAGTSSSTSPSRKEAAGTLADAHIATAEKSIKKAETATRPEEAASAKKDAAKSEANAMQYGAISQQATGKNGA